METKWLNVTRNVLYYTLAPIAFIVGLLLRLLHLLATPFIAVAQVISHVLMLPVRILLKIITTLEALLIFLGFAIFLGVVTGVIVHLVLKGCTIFFKLEQKPVPKDIPATGHDAASYRAAREEKRTKERDKEERLKMRAKLLASQPLIREVVREARRKPISGPTSSPISPNTSTSATRSGLFNQTILEHTDEEDDSAF